MDLNALGASLLKDKLGLDIDPQSIQTALGGLLGGNGGNIDLAGLASQMAGNADLGSMLGSWLGDGANSPMSADSLVGLLGQDKLSQFAGSLGVSSGDAASGLADVLPQMMDQASSGGQLLEQFTGGSGGLLGAAKSFLG